jgi:hypothetical protein
VLHRGSDGAGVCAVRTQSTIADIDDRVAQKQTEALLSASLPAAM